MANRIENGYFIIDYKITDAKTKKSLCASHIKIDLNQHPEIYGQLIYSMETKSTVNLNLYDDCSGFYDYVDLYVSKHSDLVIDKLIAKHPECEDMEFEYNIEETIPEEILTEVMGSIDMTTVSLDVYSVIDGKEEVQPGDYDVFGESFIKMVELAKEGIGGETAFAKMKELAPDEYREFFCKFEPEARKVFERIYGKCGDIILKDFPYQVYEQLL